MQPNHSTTNQPILFNLYLPRQKDGAIKLFTEFVDSYKEQVKESFSSESKEQSNKSFFPESKQKLEEYHAELEKKNKQNDGSDPFVELEKEPKEQSKESFSSAIERCHRNVHDLLVELEKRSVQIDELSVFLGNETALSAMTKEKKELEEQSYKFFFLNPNRNRKSTMLN